MFFRSKGHLSRWWKELDLVLWGIPLAMVALAGLLIASTQRQADYADWYHHWIAAGVGFLIALLLTRLPLNKLRPLLIPLYALTVLSLLAVRLIGTSALGAQRWIGIGGVHVQPSEFAKLAAILLLAAVLDRHPVERPVDLVRPLTVISVPWFLVCIQPDLGSSLVFGALLVTMLYWSGMPLEWVLLLLSPLGTALLAGLWPWALCAWIPLLGFLAYRSLPWKRLATSSTLALQAVVAVTTPWLWLHALKDYQRERLVNFLDPAKDPLGSGYQLLQSTMGIGSGGLFGTGLLQGQLTKLRFVPEQWTDFIFSALGEETGFLGTLLVVTGFALLMGRLLQVARQARTDFESLVVIGVATMVMFQVVVNIFMTIGLGPVTGIPLPFMSYGRSAMVVNFIALGLCISVAHRGQTKLNKW
ncbi:MAG TPA: rod shape-determining protein RodA [Prochlorococcus sp.]